jgi:hypothetical protein
VLRDGRSVAGGDLAATDVDGVIRDMAGRPLSDLYPRLEAYAALLERCGVPDAENGPRDGWTDAMIDAVVPHGDQEALAAALARYREAGVEEMAFLPVGVGNDPRASVERTWAALAELT